MRNAGVSEPRIAVAALNPHGGENGLFGREEIEIIGPPARWPRRRTLSDPWPFPADTVFLKAFAGEFDRVVTMYSRPGPDRDQAQGLQPRRHGDGRA